MRSDSRSLNRMSLSGKRLRPRRLVTTWLYQYVCQNTLLYHRLIQSCVWQYGNSARYLYILFYKCAYSPHTSIAGVFRTICWATNCWDWTSSQPRSMRCVRIVLSLYRKYRLIHGDWLQRRLGTVPMRVSIPLNFLTKEFESDPPQDAFGIPLDTRHTYTKSG